MADRIALVVEGESDFYAIPILLKTAGIETFSRAVFGGQPVDCSLSKLVEVKLLVPVRIMMRKGPDKIVVVIDRESRHDCPGELAQALHNELRRQLIQNFGYGGAPPISIVCADRALENWLIADPVGMRTHNYVVHDPRSRVGNNADGKDALSIIKWSYGTGRTYHKRRDAPELAKKVRSSRPEVRNRSHSLDKLIRESV